MVDTGSSASPFSGWHSYLCSCPKKFQLSLLNKNFNFVTLVRVVSMLLVKMRVLALIRLLGFPFIFFDHFKDRSSLIYINTWSSGAFRGRIVWISSRGRSCFPAIFVSFFSHLGLLWTKALLWMTCVFSIYLFNPFILLSNDCIFCIHETLG